MLTNPGFYPTPPKLISRMLAGLDFSAISTVLEPSAGKGDLAAAVAKRIAHANGHRYRNHLDDDWKDVIDCIELDETLRATLKGAGFRVVHDDFLTYQTRKHYDLIVMNPVFADGAEHLSKALELVQWGGQVRCLLNAETLKNPFTFERRVLAMKLRQLGAEISYHTGEFQDAERPTDVEVALVQVVVPDGLPDSIILEDLRKAQEAEEARRGPVTDIAPGDFVEAIVARYRFEVDAGVRLIHEYQRIRPHLLESLRGDYRSPILELTIDSRKVRPGTDNLRNGYIRLTRLKYWQALFEAPQFVGQLTSNLQRELAARVEALADYEFSRVNILSIQRDLSTQTIASIEATILAQFDLLSRQHHWDKDSANVHYYNGWATNKSWKINERVIMPGAAWDVIWKRWDFSGGRVAQELIDLEKCFTFLAAGRPPEISIASALTRAQELGQSSGICSSFFEVTVYKKGTVHIRFLRRDLLDRMNRFGGQRKGWLPPSYGKRHYADMDASERAVVDSFEGEAAYAKVSADPSAYLIESSELLRLGSAQPATDDTP